MWSRPTRCIASRPYFARACCSSTHPSGAMVAALVAHGQVEADDAVAVAPPAACSPSSSSCTRGVPAQRRRRPPGAAGSWSRCRPSARPAAAGRRTPCERGRTPLTASAVPGSSTRPSTGSSTRRGRHERLPLGGERGLALGLLAGGRSRARACSWVTSDPEGRGDARAGGAPGVLHEGEPAQTRSRRRGTRSGRTRPPRPARGVSRPSVRSRTDIDRAGTTQPSRRVPSSVRVSRT